MAFLEVKNVEIRGVACAVPKQIKDIPNLSFFAPGEAEKVMTLTGIRQSRICPEGITCSDLGFAAAEKLIAELKWDKSSIEAIIYMPIARDYYICPPTATLLQDRLKLSQDCYAVDIPLACSGYIYGLSILGSLMGNGQIKRALLFGGEQTSILQSPMDKTIWPLHGDAGTVTALEYTEGCEPMLFHLGCDGSRGNAIINPVCGARNPVTAGDLEIKEIEPGVARSQVHAVLEGMDVFNFSLTVPPKSIKSLCEHFSIDVNEFDYYLIHQANKYLVDKIVRKIKVDPLKVPYSLDEFGNVSGGTIPLTMVTRLRNQLQESRLHILGCGFGGGLSWGSVSFFTNKISIPELIEL